MRLQRLKLVVSKLLMQINILLNFIFVSAIYIT